MKVAVLGCGVIGSSWVEAFIASGMHVAVWDPNAGRTEAIIARYGGDVARAASPEDAVAGADFVQESGPEDLAAKRALFAQLGDCVGSNTVVASSTSTLLASDLQLGLPIARQIVIGHPFNPPHIIPLVEVVGGQSTSEWAVARAVKVYAGIGKQPIRLRSERRGHLANRLQAAVWREAIDSVASGQATVDEVDAAMTLALGPRWAVLGPFATFRLGGGPGGLSHFLDHLGPAFEELWDDARRPEMTDDLKRHLIASVDGRAKLPLSDVIAERDATLTAVLRAIVNGGARSVEPD